MKHRGEEEREVDVHITSAEELKKMTDEANKIGETTSSSINFQDQNNTDNNNNNYNSNNNQNALTITNINNNINTFTPRPETQQKVLNNAQKGYRSRKSISKMTEVPIEAVQFTIDRLKDYIDFRQNNDLDVMEANQIGEEGWTKFYQWFYAVCQ